MLLPALICILIALVVIANIEAWRRRTTAELAAMDRRRRTREQAWEAVAGLQYDSFEREAA